MSQVAVYLDDSTAAALEAEVRRTGSSRSALVRQAVRHLLRDRLPESFFDVLGSWEDGREPDEILRDVRAAGPQAKRTPQGE